MAVLGCTVVGGPVDNPRTRREVGFNHWDYAEWCQFKPNVDEPLHLNSNIRLLIRGCEYRWDIQGLRCNRHRTEIEPLHNLCRILTGFCPKRDSENGPKFFDQTFASECLKVNTRHRAIITSAMKLKSSSLKPRNAAFLTVWRSLPCFRISRIFSKVIVPFCHGLPHTKQWSHSKLHSYVNSRCRPKSFMPDSFHLRFCQRILVRDDFTVEPAADVVLISRLMGSTNRRIDHLPDSIFIPATQTPVQHSLPTSLHFRKLQYQKDIEYAPKKCLTIYWGCPLFKGQLCQCVGLTPLDFVFAIPLHMTTVLR